MTKLSVNVNKIATIRNARGGNNPNVLSVALDCERFGADGITVHPRPDQRHIRFTDVYELKENIASEFNIEGYPSRAFIDMVLEVKPAQVTLVPDPPEAITSDDGWDTVKHESFLKEVSAEFKNAGIRVSAFANPETAIMDGAAKCGVDRVEFYTGPFAWNFAKGKKVTAIMAYKEAAAVAHSLGLGINAGHDLDLNNLNYLIREIPMIDEVSIGHALVCDALYYGLSNTVQMYKRALKI